MKLYLFFITIMLVCGFSQCSSKNETSENSKKDILKVNKFKLRKGKTLKDWNCHEIEDNNICIPSTWKTIEQNKEYYYCEYYTKIDNISYITYSMIFNQGDFLYDISLKAEKDVASTNYYDVFQDILYNFRIKGNQFFSEKDKLKEIQIIDLSTL